MRKKRTRSRARKGETFEDGFLFIETNTHKCDRFLQKIDLFDMKLDNHWWTTWRSYRLYSGDQMISMRWIQMFVASSFDVFTVQCVFFIQRKKTKVFFVDLSLRHQSLDNERWKEKITKIHSPGVNRYMLGWIINIRLKDRGKYMRIDGQNSSRFLSHWKRNRHERRKREQPMTQSHFVQQTLLGNSKRMNNRYCVARKKEREVFSTAVFVRHNKNYWRARSKVKDIEINEHEEEEEEERYFDPSSTGTRLWLLLRGITNVHEDRHRSGIILSEVSWLDQLLSELKRILV